MRHFILAALVGLLLTVALVAPVAARRAHHSVTVLSGDSITVADTTFGGTAPFTYTLASILDPGEVLEAYGACQAVDGGWAQFAIAESDVGEFTNIGPTPTWSSGGASCTGHLVVWDGSTLTTLASTTFTVVP